MPSLSEIYSDAFDSTSANYVKAVEAEALAFMELEKLRDELSALELHLEQSFVDDAGGDPKKIGSTEKDRNRVFEIAKAKSQPIRSTKAMLYGARADHKMAQGITKALELQMKFIIATVKE